MGTKGFFLAAGVAAMLAGCSSAGGKMASYRANRPDIDAGDVRRFVVNHEEVLAQLKLLSGTSPEKEGDDWRPVVDAGIVYVDVRCDRFMDALFWFNRVRETASRQTAFVGAAAGAAQAILGAGRELVALTPIGLGLFDETVNNVGKGLLYDLSPSIVRSLVEKQQAAYLQGLSGVGFTTKAAALQAVQSYAALCLPASIETEVGRAVENADYRAVDYFGGAAPRAAEAAGDNEVPIVSRLPQPR
jgi:hypothetical protein